MLIRSHGGQATAFADKMIAKLDAVGDGEGVAMWKQISNCISQLAQNGTRN